MIVLDDRRCSQQIWPRLFPALPRESVPEDHGPHAAVHSPGGQAKRADLQLLRDHPTGGGPAAGPAPQQAHLLRRVSSAGVTHV